MRRSVLSLFFFVFIIVSPFVLKASEAPPNLMELTDDAKIVVECGAISVSDVKLIKVSGIERDIKVKDVVCKTKDVIKNVSGIDIKAGNELVFTTVGSSRLETGKDSILFLRQYSSKKEPGVSEAQPQDRVSLPDIWGVVGGGYGAFKVSEDLVGKKTMMNKFGNKDLMDGVKSDILNDNAKGLGVKVITDKDEDILKTTQGPLEVNGVVDMIKRLGH